MLSQRFRKTKSIAVAGPPCFLYKHNIMGGIIFSILEKKKCCHVSQINYSVGPDSRSKFLEMEWSSFQSPVELIKKWGTDRPKEKEVLQREEWLGRMMRFRNDAVIILSIICLQLPFELAYAHLYEVIG